MVDLASRVSGSRPKIIVVGIGLLWLGGAAGIIHFATSSFVVFLLGLTAAVALFFFFMAPLRWMPSILLWVFALTPVSVLPGNGITAIFSPALIATAIFFTRAWALDSSGYSPKMLSGMLLVLLAVTTAWSINLYTSIGWAVNFAVLVIGVIWLCTKLEPIAFTLLKFNWIAIGSILSVVGIAEHLAGRSLVPYLAQAYLIDQKYWSTFRITTTLGTPLMNGLFFSSAGALAFALFIRQPRFVYFGAFVLCSVALIFTYTRGSIYGLAIVVVAIMLISLFHRQVRPAVALGAILVLLIGGVFGLSTVQTRTSTREAAGSAAARDASTEAALVVAERYLWLGTGPRTSHRAQQQVGGAIDYDQNRDFENSYMELLVSVGIAGALAFLLLFAIPLSRAIFAGSIAEATPAMTIGISIFSFNMIEAVIPGLVILGIAIGLACQGARPKLSTDSFS